MPAQSTSLSGATRPAPTQPFNAALSLTIDHLIIALDAQPRPLRWAALRVQKRWAERRVPAFVLNGGAL